MAVHLRLQRFGAKKRPFYRIVAADSRSPRDGRFLAQLGTYDPMKDPQEIRITVDRLDHWLSVGAVPSDTVRNLIKRYRRDNPAQAATSAEAAS
jgi:small subunit ribosomal protein S16